jgi:precorrin-2 methylase
MKKNRKKLYMCSIGVELEDISLRTLTIIKSVDVVANLILEEKDLIKFGVKKYLMLNEIREKNKIEPYTKSSNFESNLYISEINKLFNKYNTVAFLTDTNPLFLYKVNFEIFKYFSKIIDIEVYPFVSSIDYFTNKVITKFFYYLQDFIIISFPYILDTIKGDLKDINVFIMYPYFFDNQSINKLLKFYNENDFFYLIKFKSYHNKEECFKKYAFSMLEKIVKDIDPFTTIFIPSKDLTKTCKKLDN